MAYQANGSVDQEAEKARSDANNTKNVRNAANAAAESKNPYAAAAGLAVKGADKITGGKASNAIGKGISAANRMFPFGRRMQNLSNRAAESGLSDKAGKGSRLVSKMHNGSVGAGISPDKMPNQAKRKGSNGGGEKDNDSLPSSSGKNSPNSNNEGNDDEKKKKHGDEESKQTDSSDREEDVQSGVEKKAKIFSFFAIQSFIAVMAIIVFPLFLIVFFLLIIISSPTLMVSSYEDFFGASDFSGEDIGGMNFNARTDEQKSFYERINTVKQNLQSQGKTLDAYKISAVYTVLQRNNSSLSYNDFTEADITEIANSMFSSNVYDESTFKNNLSSSIIPKYVSGTSSGDSSIMADEVIKLIDSYEDLMKKNNNSSYGGTSSCNSSGVCTYDIKGYYIQGKGNVSESVQLKDIYVRLMQCGVGNGHDYGGTFGKPLEGEDLVPFEKYILGVAYQEIGPNAPPEAIKAQMVAARSYILARHADMGGWRTLKEESGRWILQAASCTQDQVYCDPDKGCSSNDGQWGQIHSGLNHDSGFSRQPMAQNSPLRNYSSQTSGEVLVNKKGYIVYAGYTGDGPDSEQEQFISLANKGYDYKQILLQVYNQGSRKYGASDIYRASCTGSSSTSCRVVMGDYASWKQQGETWSNVPIGVSRKTIGDIGCLVTSIAMQIARSGVPTTISDFNPGTFVEYLNSHGGFDEYGNFTYAAATGVAPSFVFQDKIYILGKSRQEKLNIIKDLVNQPNNYVMAEVKGDTGQHWVAITSVNGDTIQMMDPGTNSNDMWATFGWENTSTLVYYKVQS